MKQYNFSPLEERTVLDAAIRAALAIYLIRITPPLVRVTASPQLLPSPLP